MEFTTRKTAVGQGRELDCSVVDGQGRRFPTQAVAAGDDGGNDIARYP